MPNPNKSGAEWKKTSQRTKKKPKRSPTGLDNFIIRTRSQSGKINQQDNMATIKGKNPNKDIVAEQTNQPLTGVERDTVSIDTEQTHTPTPQSQQLAAIQEQMPTLNAAHMSHSIDMLNENNTLNAPKETGKVASIIQQINNSPTVSPLKQPGDTTLVKPPAVRGKELHFATKENLDMAHTGIVSTPTCCTENQRLIETISQLSESTNRLNNTVTSLQLQLANMQAEQNKVSTKVSEIEVAHNAMDKQVGAIHKKLDEYDEKLESMTRIMIKQEQMFNELYAKHNDSQARAMNRNILIHSLVEKKNENCVWLVKEFFKKEMKIQEDIRIKVAHQIGRGSDRPVVVKLKFPNDKGIIFKHIPELHRKKNSKGKSFFVSEQLPEEYAERKRQHNYIKKLNSKLPEEQRVDMSFKKGQLMVRNEPFIPDIEPPSVRQLLQPTTPEVEKMCEMALVEGDEEEQDNSQFVGYAVRAKSVEQVNAAYTRVRKHHLEATHVMCAYKIPNTDSSKMEGMVDDREFGAGRHLLSLIKDQAEDNLAIFAVRYYGGKHLGPNRFNYIKQVALSAIQELQHLEHLEAAEEEDSMVEDEQGSISQESINSELDTTSL